jgi:hypothetical protein
MYCRTENRGGATSSLLLLLLLLLKLFWMQEKKSIFNGLYFARTVFRYSVPVIMQHEIYFLFLLTIRKNTIYKLM